MWVKISDNEYVNVAHVMGVLVFPDHGRVWQLRLTPPYEGNEIIYPIDEADAKNLLGWLETQKVN